MITCYHSKTEEEIIKSLSSLKYYLIANEVVAISKENKTDQSLSSEDQDTSKTTPTRSNTLLHVQHTDNSHSSTGPSKSGTAAHLP